MKFFFIIIIFLKQLNLNIKCNFLFQIETLSFDNYIIWTDISHQKIMKNSLYKSIYTTIEIGTPIQKIPLFINIREYIFEITSFSPNNSVYYHNLYNLTSIFDKYDFFKENESSSFKTDGCVKSNNMLSDHIYDCFSYDTINLKDKLGINLEIKNMEFNMVKDKEENITGVLGLGLFDKTGDINKSFLKILKQKDVIKEYNWYFLFNSWNDTSGKLMIGSLPHEDYPDIFSKDDLIYTYIPNQDFSSYNNKYKILFNEIYINSINKSIEINLFDIDAEFNFDSSVIIAPKEFETELRKKFMKNFEIKEKCFKDSIKQRDYYTDLIFYYCDINLKNELYDIFPFIKFISKDLNYIFEISKNELYRIEGEHIYLNILFDYGKKYWILGKQFSLKYQFVFDQDSNKIGFYKNKNQKIYINDNKNYYNKKIQIFLIIVLSFCLVFIGFYSGKKIYQIKRKIRANELNDNYEYINENNSHNNNFKEIINNNNLNERNTTIEMRIKL